MSDSSHSWLKVLPSWFGAQFVLIEGLLKSSLQDGLVFDAQQLSESRLNCKHLIIIELCKSGKTPHELLSPLKYNSDGIFLKVFLFHMYIRPIEEFVRSNLDILRQVPPPDHVFRTLHASHDWSVKRFVMLIKENKS